MKMPYAWPRPCTTKRSFRRWSVTTIRLPRVQFDSLTLEHHFPARASSPERENIRTPNLRTTNLEPSNIEPRTPRSRQERLAGRATDLASPGDETASRRGAHEATR